MKPRPDPKVEKNEEASSESPDDPDSLGGGQQQPITIWPLVAAMDYLIEELGLVSPMSAHLMRMSRQNLIDEAMANRKRASR